MNPQPPAVRSGTARRARRPPAASGNEVPRAIGRDAREGGRHAMMTTTPINGVERVSRVSNGKSVKACFQDAARNRSPAASDDASTSDPQTSLGLAVMGTGGGRRMTRGLAAVTSARSSGISDPPSDFSPGTGWWAARDAISRIVLPSERSSAAEIQAAASIPFTTVAW